MTITPHSLATESVIEELALLMVGEKKAGKSYMAGTAPGTIFYFDFDQRLNALRSHPNAKNIYGMTFADPTSTAMMPTALNEALDIMNKIEQKPFLSNLHESFKGLDKPIDTIVLDSVQTIADAAQNYVLYNGNDIARSFAIGGRVYRVNKSYTGWGAEMNMATSFVLQARALLHCKKCWKSCTSWNGPSLVDVKQNMYQVVHTDELVPGTVNRAPNAPKYDHQPEPRAMNVIVTLHEAAEEDPRSTQENPIYTGKITVYPVRYNKLLVYFNEVWRLTRDRGRVPTVTCDPDGKFIQAATALGLPADVKFEPDIQQILNKARQNRPR